MHKYKTEKGSVQETLLIPFISKPRTYTGCSVPWQSDSPAAGWYLMRRMQRD